MFKLLFSLPQMLFFGFAGITGIGLLILIHECGHFFFCKLFRVSTPTFSIGFGPKLLSKKIGATNFTLSAIPLGGYVEIAGLAEIGQGEQTSAHQADRYAFSSKPYYQKALILLGGITFNILFAFLAFCAIFWTGTPDSPLLAPANTTTTISAVKAHSAADKAGLIEGDTIIALNNIHVKNDVATLQKVLQERVRQDTSITVERDGVRMTKQITPDATVFLGKKSGSLSVAFKRIKKPGVSLVQACKNSFTLTKQWMKNTAQAYANLLRSRDTRNVSGPLGLFETSMKGAAQGITIFLALLAIISINLAVLNLIPLPIADGGQLVLQTIETIIRRPLPIRLKEYIFMASWILFIVIAIYFSAKDILRMTGTYLSSLLQLLGLK